MKAKKAESRSRLAKPPKAIKWKSSEVYHLRRNLAHVQSKLNRIHLLGPRLAVEAPELQVGDLISRLRRRKKELIKKISEEDKKILKKRPKSGGVPKGGGGVGRRVVDEQHIVQTDSGIDVANDIAGLHDVAIGHGGRAKERVDDGRACGTICNLRA